MARFSDISRSYSSEDGHVHYLAILNPSNLDMFVLVRVDETNEQAVSISKILSFLLISLDIFLDAFFS